MNKLQIKEKISSRECFDFVFDRLNSVDNLVKGIVAGQSVASAIVEYLNFEKLINPVYNDIDIFKPISSDFFNLHRTSDFFKSLDKKENLTATGFINISEINRYSDFTFEFKTKNKILGSFRKDDINKTFIKVPDSLIFSTDILVLDIISSFDINSTQVGFYYGKSEKLVFTDNFIEFLYTKELKISKWETPLHSLIRLYKKNQDFGSNVFVNNEEMDMLSLLYANSVRALNSFVESEDLKVTSATTLIKQIPLAFGEKNKEVFINLGMEDKFNLFNSGKFHSYDFKDIQNKKNNINKIYNDLIAFDDGISFGSRERQYMLNDILNGSFKSSNIYANDIRSQFFHSTIGFLPNIYLSLKNTRKKTKKLIVEKYEKNVIPRKDEISCLINSSNYKINDFQVLDKYKVFLSKHPRLINYFNYSGVGVDKQAIILKNIIKVEKETDVIVGLIESNLNNVAPISLLSLEETRGIAARYLKGMETPIKDRLVDFETEDYKVRELITKRELKDEGKELHHCVGGYGDAIRSGRSIIIQFVPKNKNGTRCTMELNSYNDNSSYGNKTHTISILGKDIYLSKLNYSMVQIRGKQNASVFLDLSLYKALEKVSSKYSFLPMPFFESNSFKDISLEVRPYFIEKHLLNSKGILLKTLIGNRFIYSIGKLLENGMPTIKRGDKRRREILTVYWKYNSRLSKISKILLNNYLSYSPSSSNYLPTDIEELTYKDFLKVKSIEKHYYPDRENNINEFAFIPEIPAIEAEDYIPF